MTGRTLSILVLAPLTAPALNGSIGSFSTLPDDGAGVADGAVDKSGSRSSPSEKAPDEGVPRTGAPILGLPVVGSTAAEHGGRAFRTFSPAPRRTLPVGLWHGQALCVPRPLSRLDRVVATSLCDAVTPARVARSLRPHAPPV